MSSLIANCVNVSLEMSSSTTNRKKYWISIQFIESAHIATQLVEFTFKSSPAALRSLAPVNWKRTNFELAVCAHMHLVVELISRSQSQYINATAPMVVEVRVYSMSFLPVIRMLLVCRVCYTSQSLCAIDHLELIYQCAIWHAPQQWMMILIIELSIITSLMSRNIVRVTWVWVYLRSFVYTRLLLPTDNVVYARDAIEWNLNTFSDDWTALSANACH